MLHKIEYVFEKREKEYVSKKRINKLARIISITSLVVILSIASLALIILGGFKDKRFKAIAICASVCLAAMFIGAIGSNLAINGILPKNTFGILERFSVMSATAFNAVLGIFMFQGKFFVNEEVRCDCKIKK